MQLHNLKKSFDFKKNRPDFGRPSNSPISQGNRVSTAGPTLTSKT